MLPLLFVHATSVALLRPALPPTAPQTVPASLWSRRAASAPRLRIVIDDDRSWTSPTWLWGLPEGDAHEACKAMRMEFGEKSVSSGSHRAFFLQTVGEGEADDMDVKLALALACDRAAAEDRDDADWAGLLADMVACRFEGEEGEQRLRIALSTRLRPPPPLDEPMGKLCVRALDALDFRSRGL